MSMLQTMKVLFFLCIFVFFSAAAAIAGNAMENRIDSYKFHVYIIYPENTEDTPKLLYHDKRFEGNDEGGLEEDFTMLISQGEYIEYKDFAFNACQFALESTVTGERRQFYFDCDAQKKYYFLINFNKEKNIFLKPVKAAQGRFFLENFKKSRRDDMLR